MPVEKEGVEKLFDKTPYKIKKDGYTSDYTAVMSEKKEQELPLAGQIKTDLLFIFSEDGENNREYSLKERIYFNSREKMTLWKATTDNLKGLQQKTMERFQEHY